MSFSEKKSQNRELAGLIVRDFNLENDQLGIDRPEISEIKNHLKKILDHLLSRDFERLLNAMYRLDINEDQFREVINGSMGNDVSDALADIIIERELRKVQTRMKYREKRAQ